MLKRILGGVASASILLPVWCGATIIVDPDPWLLESWTNAAERAERAIYADAASEPALQMLRQELMALQIQGQEARAPLLREVQNLESRIAAFATADANSEDGETNNSRLQELNAQLREAMIPLQEIDELALWSVSLVRGLDEILLERRKNRLLQSGESPLIPGNWLNAAEHVASRIASLNREASAVLSSDAQRQVLRGNLLTAVGLIGLGTLLLTGARTRLRHITSRAWQRLGLTGQPGSAAMDDFLIRLLLPAAGVELISVGILTTQLFSQNADLFGFTVPAMAVAVFGAGWLQKVLLGDGRVHGHLANPRSAGALVQTGGWVIAAELLATWLLKDIDEAGSIGAAIGFPVLASGAAVLFFLGRNMVGSKQSDSKGKTDSGLVGSAMSVLGRLAQAAGLVGLFGAAASFGSAAQHLILSSLYSLAILGVIVILQVVLSDLVSAALRCAAKKPERDRSKLISAVAGTVLFAAALPELAVLWGLTDMSLREVWDLVLEGVWIGDQQFTLVSFITLAVIVTAGFVGTGVVQRILSSSVLPDTNLDKGAQRALTTGIGYVGIILTLSIGLSAAGFNLTNLAIVAGALSVGIGFGLQAVVSNFVSGIILLIERPINVGDWIEVGGNSGTVQRISVRSTVIETFDRASVVVPNADLVSNQVVNWTLTNRMCRTIVPVGVAYASDPRRVENILRQIACEHPAVMNDPEPSVMLMNFGPDALEFELRAILHDTGQILSTKSDINFAIAERFEKEGISIPFPQRDVWIRNAPESGASPGGSPNEESHANDRQAV